MPAIFHLLWPLFLLPALLFGYIVFITSLTYYRFSPAGGDYQNRINTPGALLDIGCGSGNLSIKIAKKYPDARVIGFDYWGKEWEYGLSQCESNAKLENVPSVAEALRILKPGGSEKSR